MKLILLPGNSSKNKPWIQKVEKLLSPSFDSTYAHFWQHWSGNSTYLNPSKELQIIQNKLKKPYSIFAKSAGVSITLKGIKQNLLSPESCIFVGTAANLSSSTYSNLLSILDIPLLFIQQNKDPYNKANSLKQTLKTINPPNYQFHEVKGSDHIYTNLKEITKIIQNFLSQNS